MFSGVDESAWPGIERAAFLSRLTRAQPLFTEGEPAEHLYVIRSGAVKVHLTSPGGADVLLALVSQGRSLGEVTVIDNGPRSASATALSDTVMLAVPSRTVRDVLRANPSAVWALAQALAADVRRLTERTADMAFLDLPRRLAKLLLDSATVGRDGTAVFAMVVNQTELASMIGVSRQALNKAISDFAARGWIETDPHALRLVDTDALERFVYA